MSSHILAEVDRLATRIGIVHRGRLVEELGSEALEHHRDARLEVGIRDVALGDAVLRGAGFLPRRPDADALLLELREPRAIEAPDEVARILVEGGSPPTRLAVTRETLEDHFMRLTASDPPAIRTTGTATAAEVAA